MKFKFEIIPINKEDNSYKLFKSYEYTNGSTGGCGRYELFRGTKEECLERKRELANGTRKNNPISGRIRKSENKKSRTRR